MNLRLHCKALLWCGIVVLTINSNLLWANIKNPGRHKIWHKTYSKDQHNRLRSVVNKKGKSHRKDKKLAGKVRFLVQEVKNKNSKTLSRYGNPHSYKIYGQNYHILKNASGYKTRGIASWYGTEFHRMRTSSGDSYNMYAMTAAHKTLPLPTYVKVTNLLNDKKVVVKINDRGPFHKGRIIDLSYAAATKLGILSHGTAPVEIEALSSVNKNYTSDYYLQAGAFSSEKSALSLRHKLRQITLSNVEIEKSNQHYFVKIGPLGDRDMLKNLQTKLFNRGIVDSLSFLK